MDEFPPECHDFAPTQRRQTSPFGGALVTSTTSSGQVVSITAFKPLFTDSIPLISDKRSQLGVLC